MNEVCGECAAKDSKDVGKLKSYLSFGYVAGQVTKCEVSASTGITMKNLNRILSGNEFEGVYIPETLKGDINIDNKNIIAKV
jgi:hypothetical protein